MGGKSKQCVMEGVKNSETKALVARMDGTEELDYSASDGGNVAKRLSFELVVH